MVTEHWMAWKAWVTWRDEYHATMAMAVAKGESNLVEWANGDHISTLSPEIAAQIGSRNCLGYTSFGLFQINIHFNWDRLVTWFRTTDPCVIATKLKDPDHNVSIAYSIWLDRLNAGLDPWSPWSVYRFGIYRRYWDWANAWIRRIMAEQREDVAPEVEAEPVDHASRTPGPENIGHTRFFTALYAKYLEAFNPADVG